MVDFQPPHNRVELRLRGLIAHAWLQAGDGDDRRRPDTRRRSVGGHLERRPHITLEVEHRKLELRRHDADDRVRMAVEGNCLTED
jgi:hypothetical protein